MEKAVYMEKQLYDKINQVAFSNEIEQLMLFGGRIKDNSVNLDSDTIKWFSKNELVYQDGESFEIDEGVLVRSIMSLCEKGYDAVFMIHSHHCDTKFDDFMYGSLSEDDIKNSKRLYLICQFKNIKFFDGIATGQHIYFWSIDNDKMIPTQMSCYIDNELVNSRVPGTIQELFEMIMKKNK